MTTLVNLNIKQAMDYILQQQINKCFYNSRKPSSLFFVNDLDSSQIVRLMKNEYLIMSYNAKILSEIMKIDENRGNSKFSSINHSFNIKINNKQSKMQKSEPFVGSSGKIISHNHVPALKQIDTRWVQMKFSKSFSPRSYFASCIQAGNIYIHGGFSCQSGVMKDFYTTCLYDQPVTWKRLDKVSDLCYPGALQNHTLSCHLSNLILVGGQRNVLENNKDIYGYDLITNKWSICECIDQNGKNLKVNLDSHTSIVYQNYLFVFNGYDSISTNYIPDIIKINLSKLSENILTFDHIKCEGNRPSLRGNSGFSLVGNKVYIFGGANVDTVYGDLWTLNLGTNEWTELKKTQHTIAWPESRKGGSLTYHDKSHTLFLFGGIKKITKQQNDVMVYMIDKRKWIKIHSSTNQLYDPSPTLRQLVESPTIYEQKRRRERIRSHTYGNGTGFKLKQVGKSNHIARMHETSAQAAHNASSRHNNTEVGNKDGKRRVSVVQQQKYKQFLIRKEKLLKNLQSDISKHSAKKRSRSPTSQALMFSIDCMGEQSKEPFHQMNLPKVIYDDTKGHVIGKKPCARDGHSALLHEQCMIIIGGDRHMVSFNDAYIFKLNKGVECLPHYE